MTKTKFQDTLKNGLTEAAGAGKPVLLEMGLQ